MFIYCAGAYSGDILGNILHTLAHAEHVTKAGGHPVLPHTSHPQARDWDHAMRLCQPQLLNCHAVYLIPGWEQSPGAVVEKGWAEAAGIPVLTNLAAMRKWLGAA